jgi:hypothetical protein
MEQHQLKLVVSIVVEECKEDKVIWHLDTQKGFLPTDAEVDTPPVNPLHLNIQRSTLKDDAIFRYPLPS